MAGSDGLIKMLNRVSNKIIEDNPRALEGADTDDHAILDYLKQLNALVLIRMLNPLIIACQQHRGASTVLLQGNGSFQPLVDALQTEIQKRIHALKTINHEYGHPIAERALAEIALEWEVLAQEWSRDTVITNFDFHSHFIEKLLGFMWDITQKAGYFFAPTVGVASAEFNLDGSGVPIAPRKVSSITGARIKKSDHHAVVTIVIRDIPELIETMAKVRGLATHATVIGHCDRDHQLRLGTLLVELNHQKEKLIKSLRPLQHYMLSGMPALVDTLLHEHKLNQLLDLVNQEILGRSNITLESHQLFNFVTGIIEIYCAVIEQGIILIQRNNERAIFS